MKTDDIYEAKKVAKKFNDAANALLNARNSGVSLQAHPRESGALRRASMDLTRQLAKMRKG